MDQRSFSGTMPLHPRLTAPNPSKMFNQDANEASSVAVGLTRDPSGLKYVEPKPMETETYTPHQPSKHGRVRCFSLCGGEKSRTGKLLSQVCCACCGLCKKCLGNRPLPGWVGCCMRCFACRSIDRVPCH